MLEALINTVCLIHIQTSSRFGTGRAVTGKVQGLQEGLNWTNTDIPCPGAQPLSLLSSTLYTQYLIAC